MNELNFYFLHLGTLEEFTFADFLDNHTSLFCSTSFYFYKHDLHNECVLINENFAKETVGRFLFCMLATTAMHLFYKKM